MVGLYRPEIGGRRGGGGPVGGSVAGQCVLLRQQDSSIPCLGMWRIVSPKGFIAGCLNS